MSIAEHGARGRRGTGRLVLIERYPYGGCTSKLWRAWQRLPRGGFTEIIIHEDAVEDLQPAPEFEIGERVRTLLGLVGHVVEIVDHPRRLYGLAIPITLKSG